MNDTRQGEYSEARWRRIRAALEGPVLIGALVVGILVLMGQSRRSDKDWLMIALGLLFGLHVITDAHVGRTHVVRRPRAEDPTDYVRSADPIGFWIVIALKCAVAAFVVIGAVGDLLGLWNWS